MYEQSPNVVADKATRWRMKWTTIPPTVGGVKTRCIEHYEKKIPSIRSCLPALGTVLMVQLPVDKLVLAWFMTQDCVKDLWEILNHIDVLLID